MIQFCVEKLGDAGETLIMSFRASFELIVFNTVIELFKLKQPFSCCCKVVEVTKKNDILNLPETSIPLIVDVVAVMF